MLAGISSDDRSKRAQYVPLQRCIAGFHLTDLVRDIRLGGPYTLIAPVDGAFDELPWSYESLLADDELVEPLFDLFEYLVIPGACDGDGPIRSWLTLQGEKIRVGRGYVLGRRGVGRILATVSWKGSLVHAVDACVFPSSVLGEEMTPAHC